MPRLLAMLLATAVALVAPCARAQSSDVAQARAEFERGVHLMQDARFAEAVAAFEHSLAIHSSGAALYNLGLSLRELRAYRRSVATLERFIALASNPDPALVTQARSIVAELRRSLAHVTIVVTGGATEVDVDAERVASADGRYEVDVDPGHRVFEARRRGFRMALELREVTAGQRLDVTLNASAEPLPPGLALETR